MPANAGLLNSCAQMLGVIRLWLVKSSPYRLNWLIMAVLVTVKPKLIMNLMKSRFTPPKISL